MLVVKIISCRAAVEALLICVFSTASIKMLMKFYFPSLDTCVLALLGVGAHLQA